MSVTSASSVSPLGALLREWRAARGKSQLALAVRAGVSSRHLSFIETGRATPSRSMVLLLADALEVPLRERNALLEAAGFAAQFRETPLDAPEMAPVRRAVDAILRAHGENPAIVVNRRCDVLLANEAAQRFVFFLVGAEGVARGVATNMVRLLFSRDGARPSIVNWFEVASEIAYRLRREVGGGEAEDIVRAIVGDDLDVPVASPALTREGAARPTAAILPIHLRHAGTELHLFSTVTTLGTPLDVTLQELRIEGLFASDTESEARLRAIVTAP